MTEPKCPMCNSEHSYYDRNLWICPMCSHEWALTKIDVSDEDENESGIKDAYANILQDGDSVVVIKDLKIKGSSSVIKGGTKVKSIRLIQDATDGHNIACKIDSFGAINLKSEFVKKA
ncbi:MAG: alkylphosphonate utilization protein [Oligoflexales bacterium]|nr:alkylphosphonate utilization protein [Oligoflexales bacterium]